MLTQMIERDVNTSEDKNDTQMSGSGLSEEAETKITELNNMHGEGRKKVFELIETLRTKDKLKDHEIKKVLIERVKFLSRSQLYEYMPPELKREYTKPKQKSEAKEIPFYEEAKKKKGNDDDKDYNESEDAFINEVNKDVPITTIEKPALKEPEPDYEAEYRKETEGKINSLDVEPPFRLAILEPEKSTAEFMRQISKLKGRGWKIIEVQVRYIS